MKNMCDEMKQLEAGSRVKIFVGEFGSGKTEVSINYALKLKRRGFQTAIVDMDLVKPYFRTRENRLFIESSGIFLACPEPRLSHSDLPVMPQQVTRFLYDKNCQVIIDVGGGETAIVLAQFKKQLEEVSYEAYFIINTCRPFSKTVEEIEASLNKLEKTSKIKVTGLISNTNIGNETTLDHLMGGVAIAESVSERLSLPLTWVVVSDELAGQLHEKVKMRHPILSIQTYTHYPWADIL